MLTIHILNVSHGDAQVIQYDGPDGTHFAVIDSNVVGPGDPPALRKLQELGATSLSFVALTHPHADHYKGLAQIINAFSGKIGNLYTFPIGIHIQGRLASLAKVHQKIRDKTDSATQRGQLEEFVRILLHGKKKIGLNNWQEPTGSWHQIFPIGFGGVDLHTILPGAGVKGHYFQMIETGKNEVAEGAKNLNELSLAFSLTYGGQRVVLGGDGTYNNWHFRRRQLERSGQPKLGAVVAKLPHHGSKLDSRADVLDHIFAGEGDRFACVSANGQSHPDPEIYKNLKDRGIKPYCTNLAVQCGAKLRQLVRDPAITPVLERFINMTADSQSAAPVMTCQGDITIRITPHGAISVTPQVNNPCPYRGGYDDLFAA